MWLEIAGPVNRAVPVNAITWKNLSPVSNFKLDFWWDIDQLKPLSATVVSLLTRAFAGLRHHQGER